MQAKRRVFVVGVGMTKFEKPGKKDWDYPEMARIAVTAALADAGIPFNAVQQAAVGYVYGDSTCGQRALYEVGISGIPIYNVNNNCATGSTALYVAKQFIEGGQADCVLALGFEKMDRGSLGSKFTDRTNPLDKHMEVMLDTFGFANAPGAPQMFGNAGREHMKLYGTKLEHFAKIAEKNHRHSANNPYSQFQDVYTLDEVLKSKKVHEPLTMLQCCPTSDGAGAALLCSEDFVFKYGLQSTAVEILGMAMTTDFRSTFDQKSMIKVVGYDMTKAAAEQVYKQAGKSAADAQVIELHDCFSANELLTYEALGLCEVGKAGELIDKGDNTYGGRWVVNPSGGLISKGHPLGATGLAQCAELCWQVRGKADKRQVKGAKIGLQHNLGLGGAAVVAMYGRPTWPATPPKTSVAGGQESVGTTTAGHSPLTPVTTPQLESATPKAKPDKKPAAAAAAAAPSAPAKKEKPSAPSTPSAPAGGLAAEAVFTELAKRMNADMVKKVGCVYRFDVTSADGGVSKSWVVNLKEGNGSITVSDANAKADCMIIIKDPDFVALMSGQLNAQQAFMKGQFKIKGNMMLAQKLSALSAQKSAL